MGIIKFKDKTALVTGAAVGIGCAVILRLAQEWAKLVLVDVNAEKLSELKDALKAVLPKMLENGYGRIINVGSVAGVYGNANLICFLASDEASYISGQNIQIDGCRKKQ